MPTTRPLAVTCISWAFIIWALLSTIPKTLIISDPEAYRFALEFHEELSKQGLLGVPLWFQLAHSFVGVVVFLVSGVFMLRGKFWALVVFLVWISGVLVLTLAVSSLSFSLYMKLFIAALVAAMLTTPATLQFFRSGKTTMP